MFKKVLRIFILSMMLMTLAASAQVHIGKNFDIHPDEYCDVNSLFVKNTPALINGSAAIIGFLIAVSVLLAAGVVFSVVKMRKIEKQSRINEMTDPETGIGNRVYFEHHFRNTISDFSRRLYYISYIIIDSNYLQTYHGDVSLTTALKYTANLLSVEAKHYEIAARISESGFAFAFQSTDENAAQAKVEELVERLNHYVGGDEESVKIVFHAAVCNLEDNDRNCKMLLFNLRKNCNEIVESDDSVVFCDSHMMNRVQTDKKIAENIERGLKNGEFKLYLQFIVDNKTKKIVSAEALSRWENPEKGLVPPGKYIDVMNVTGVITAFDYYMFELVCKQLEKWRQTSLADISLSCNITRITISEKDFADKIEEIAKKYSFDRGKLTIEITEDAIEQNMENARHNVAECKKMGFLIALDDFGSGYTSLVNLCEYPIDFVKIDRDILWRMEQKGGKELFRGIIALSHSLNLKTVCEGVETDEQNVFVSQSGGDYIQGWFYSRPIPEQSGEEFVMQYNTRSL